MPDSKDKSAEETEHLIEGVCQPTMESTESVAPSRVLLGKQLFSIGLVHMVFLLLYATISGIIISSTSRSCEQSRNGCFSIQTQLEYS